MGQVEKKKSPPITNDTHQHLNKYLVIYITTTCIRRVLHIDHLFCYTHREKRRTQSWRKMRAFWDTKAYLDIYINRRQFWREKNTLNFFFGEEAILRRKNSTVEG